MFRSGMLCSTLAAIVTFLTGLEPWREAKAQVPHHAAPVPSLHAGGGAWGGHAAYGPGVPGVAPPVGHWQPGGYEGRIGSPYYYSGAAPLADYGVGPSAAYGNFPNVVHYSAASPAYGYGAGDATGYGLGFGYGGGGLYYQHFGPGFYRYGDYGHYRFPFYSYRRPWYFPGPAQYNRDTNFAW